MAEKYEVKGLLPGGLMTLVLIGLAAVIGIIVMTIAGG